MKKFFLCAFALGCFAVAGAQDFRFDDEQPTDTTPTVTPSSQRPEHTYSELDSHQQAVNVLQTQIDERNRKDKLRSVWEKRSTFFNIGYVNETLTNKDMETLWSEMKSKYGVSISIGHTYYMPRKPILGMIRFGIDCTWLDLNYGYFDNKEEANQQDYGMKGQIKEYINYSGEKIDLTTAFPGEKLYEPMRFGHHISAGIGVGPSVTVNPVGDLKISGYFHVVPTYNCMLVKTDKLEVWQSYDDQNKYNKGSYRNTEILHGFTLMTKFGASIAFKAISLGVESRSGSGKMRYEETDDIVAGVDKGEAIKQKFKVSTTRFYIGFRF